MSRQGSVWFVNQYARGASSTGGIRHVSIAGNLSRMGFAAHVIAGEVRGRNFATAASGRSISYSEENGVLFGRLPVAGYTRNGPSRLLSMLAFGIATAIAKPDRLSRPQVIVGSSPHLFAAMGAYIAARRLGAHFVLEVRDIWPESLIAVGGVSRRNPMIRLMRYLEVYLYRHSELIVCLMPGFPEYLDRMGIATPTEYIPNGVELSRLADRAVQPASDEFRIVYAGAHGGPNNLSVLLDAAAELEADGYVTPDGRRVTFVLIGDGVEKQKLTDMTISMGLQSVRFLEPCDKEAAWKHMESAEVLALPGQDVPLYRWGVSPNKLFDYFAVGRPIIFGIDTPFDPVAESGAGLTIPPNDSAAFAEAVRSLASMTATQRGLMGLAGRSVAEKHDVTVLAGRYADIIRRLSSAPHHA